MEASDDTPLAARVRAERLARGWTLERFAEASGVSRAMISKIERGEVSPTASVLARLAGGLGVTLASLFAETGVAGSPLARHDGQPVWTDPETGYSRRNVSPSSARGTAEIVEVIFPAGGRVMFDNPSGPAEIGQQIWLIEGMMDLTLAGASTRLKAGDCLFMRLGQPIIFHNPGDQPARYVVVLARAPF